MKKTSKTTTTNAKPAKAKAATNAKLTRTELCGRVLAKHGLEAPLADQVAEVDRLYGKPNPRETLFWLRGIRSGINGYLAATGKKAK